MHRIRKHVPIYQQPHRPNTGTLETYMSQGIHILEDDETLVDGLVKRWCSGTPGRR